MVIEVEARQCSDCRKETPIKDIYIKDYYVVIVTECRDCNVEYQSKFLWPSRVIPDFHCRAAH